MKNVKRAVKNIFVWFNIENVNESRFLYEICSKLFCRAYIAAGSPEAVNAPTKVHSLYTFFRVPSFPMKNKAHTT